MDWITSGLAPLYTIGVKLYNYMLGFSLGFGLNTPQGASSTAWAYVSGTLFPFFQAIAATMLNLFFYIGICRQVGNLRESMTIETGVNVLIKVLLGNLAINSVLWFSKWVFSVTNVTGGVIIGESDFRGLEDSSVNEVQLMVLMVIGIIFLIIAIVCAATIFITMVGRIMSVRMLSPKKSCRFSFETSTTNITMTTIENDLLSNVLIHAPAAFCIPGPPGIHETASGPVAASMYNCIVLPTIVINMFMMMLTAAGVKGADLFLKQTFGI